MNKIIIFILAFLGFAFISIACIRILSGEDDWLCKEGEWVKHGNPSASMPERPCPL
jgi:hypothetical protein